MAAITRRRAANEALQQERMSYVEDVKKTGQVVAFEKSSSARVEKNRILEKAKKLAEADAKDLEKRREDIQQLYQREMQGWREVLEKKSHKSTEQRMDEIRNKAFRLRDAREAERKVYIKDCYDRQWRASSDEARQAESKAMTERLLHDRFILTDDRKDSPEEEVKRNKDIESGKRQLSQQSKGQRTEEELKNFQLKQALDLQVALKREQESLLLNEQQREDFQQQELWRADERAAKEYQARSIEENRARGLEDLKINSLRLQEREKALAETRKQDEVLLSYSLDRERNDIFAEMQAKEQGKGMAMEYKEFLQEQMTLDQADSSRIDAIRDAMLDEIWIKRDADLRAQVEARQRLMVEVDAGRRAQIADKVKKIEAERAELAEHVLRDIEKARMQDAREREEQLKARARTCDVMKVNVNAADRKRQEKDKEKQASLLERNEMEDREQRNKERLVAIGKTY
mmetsp:Transcript_21062/g.43029  ORF Transcript_21062/g.43029 Transcript_21062/m.43029 type:complete len:460 (+) Transcript_21062:427-1806(+)|eukprot:CAMPEP_0178704246 /NCGR_PEP_ID=MMETSP0699-20121125/14062_1 /TAXON_ID=265572 /ORGANISM="Extubocellulus spinifer, Strain CCMP396" /LENGTH=459 /DNA_ID=CAMNT_0020351549 /DNA_START=481 /DNA_END=1860 /DNA_ORIENTATION=-